MRKLERPHLSARALNVLAKRTISIRDSTDQNERSKKLWRSKNNRAFREIKDLLNSSCTGRVRCMYCEDSEATDIEHFYPKSRYPLKTFTWENYLLACSNCNSNYKRTLFPLSITGNPDLINPFEDDPFTHLALSLNTGKFVALTEKGNKSIAVFGLDRQTLERGRRDTWTAICALVTRYGSLDRTSQSEDVQSIIHALERISFSCVARVVRTSFFLGTLGDVAPANFIHVLDESPEILAAM